MWDPSGWNPSEPLFWKSQGVGERPGAVVWSVKWTVRGASPGPDIRCESGIRGVGPGFTLMSDPWSRSLFRPHRSRQLHRVGAGESDR